MAQGMPIKGPDDALVGSRKSRNLSLLLPAHQPIKDASVTGSRSQQGLVLSVPEECVDLLGVPAEGLELPTHAKIKETDLLVLGRGCQPVAVDGVPSDIQDAVFVSVQRLHGIPSGPRIPQLYKGVLGATRY